MVGPGGGHEQPRAGDRSTCLSALPTNPETEVPKAGTVLYLLNPEHRSGKRKARFFSGHGYTADTGVGRNPPRPREAKPSRQTRTNAARCSLRRGRPGVVVRSLFARCHAEKLEFPRESRPC